MLDRCNCRGTFGENDEGKVIHHPECNAEDSDYERDYFVDYAFSEGSQDGQDGQDAEGKEEGDLEELSTVSNVNKGLKRVSITSPNLDKTPDDKTE